MEFDEEYDEPELENLITTDTSDQPVNEGDYIFSLNITDNLRQIFILVVIVGSFVSVNIAIVFMCLAWFVRSSIEKHITFLQDFYNPQSVPAMVGISGFVMLVVSVFGVKVGIGGRMMDEEEDMQPAADLMFKYAVAAAITFGAVLITALTCFIEIAILNSALEDGLRSGMKKYKEVSEFKPEIDSVQMKYKCCGINSYKDWYNISWVDSKYLDTNNGFIRQFMKNNDYFGKDVPFSCCKLGVMRPCVDTRVEDGSYNSKYSFPSDLTLHKTGCKEAISGFLGHAIFKGVGLFVFFCSFLWISLAVIGRYLNTSMVNVSLGGPPVGWLIPYANPKKRVTFNEGEEEWEEEEEA